MKRLRQLSKRYDDERVQEANTTAEVDKNVFWRMLRKTRDGPKVKVPSVKDKQGRVKHDLKDILEIWRTHFSNLATPKDDPDYDNDHFEHVTTRVSDWCVNNDMDEFCREPFSRDEISKGIRKLNGGKSPGHDFITKEHLMNAGPSLIYLLSYQIFEMILHMYTTEFSGRDSGTPVQREKYLYLKCQQLQGNNTFKYF